MTSPAFGGGWYKEPAEHTETGQINYEAFGRAAGMDNWQPWEQLLQHQQDAWREAAHQVMQKGWVNSARKHRKST